MASIYDKWIPLEEVRKLFNYKATQMAELLKNKMLIVSKYGKRKFELRESLDMMSNKSNRAFFFGQV